MNIPGIIVDNLRVCGGWGGGIDRKLANLKRPSACTCILNGLTHVNQKGGDISTQRHPSYWSKTLITNEVASGEMIWKFS